MDLKFYIDRYRSSNSYTQKADKTITQVGLVFPLAMTAYGLLIQFGVVRSSNNFLNLPIFIIISIIFISVGVTQTIRPGSTPLLSTIRLLEFYTMVGIYLLLIAGIYNPFTFCWPILMLASYTYFEKTGLWLGILAFLSVIATDIFLFHFKDPKVIMSDILIFITVVFTGIAIISVMKTHEIRKAKLLENLIKESVQRDRVATIVNNLTDAIISTDTNGVIKVYNAASMALLDTNSSLNGRNISNVLSLVDKNDKNINIIDELKHSKSVTRRDDLSYVFKDGEKIRLETTYTPIRGGYNRSKRGEVNHGYIIIMRDITKSKSLEEERNEFISVISHELRTPITITEGTISNIQEMMEHTNITSRMLSDSISVAHDQILLLANIVNDLSALSRAERGMDNEQQEVDVHNLIHDLLDKYSDEAKSKKLKVSAKIDHNINTVYASKTYLEELLKNLFLNAIKYTKKGGVSVLVTDETDTVKFSIKDSGIGISKTDQPHIFEKFYRSEDFRTRETGGTGLGLYVASKLASNMDTRIELESKLDVGSTFSFSVSKKKRKQRELDV